MTDRLVVKPQLGPGRWPLYFGKFRFRCIQNLTLNLRRHRIADNITAGLKKADTHIHILTYRRNRIADNATAGR